MMMVAAVTESGAEADGTFAILQHTMQRITMQCDGGVAVMVRAAAIALAMV